VLSDKEVQASRLVRWVVAYGTDPVTFDVREWAPIHKEYEVARLCDVARYKYISVEWNYGGVKAAKITVWVNANGLRALDELAGKDD
jgi:hypothetical protein